MKKFIMTIAILLGLSMASFAQGGLFHRGASAADDVRSEYSFTRNGGNVGEPTPMLPNHDATGDNQPAPLGSGIAVLSGLSAAYLLGKRRKE